MHIQDPDGRRLRFSALQSEVGKQLLVFCGRRAEENWLRMCRQDSPDPVCCTIMVGMVRRGITHGVSRLRVASVTDFFWTSRSTCCTQDLSSMLVVKPDGECLSQSDAVVFAAA